jgi:RNA polymerase sigma factor (sigma-70 family)
MRRNSFGSGWRTGLHVSAPEPPVSSVGREALVNAGPDQALEQVYREDGARLWRALVAFSGDPEVASDAVAEAFAQALGRGDAIHSPGRWVWRAAFRIAAGELQQRRRTAPNAREATYDMPDPPADLISALARISPNQRAAVVLRHYVGYTTGEIAEILGVQSTTVRVHLSQARRRLRRLLEEQND